MNASQQGCIRIGTSGIVLPGTKLTFPEEFQTGTRLQYYGSLFNTLEINSSFYKIPLAKTFARWATEVPNEFKFTVKLWRGITHARNLAYTANDIDAFMQSASHLGNKKGCLLIQLPASITVKYLKEVDTILQQLNNLNQQDSWQLAIEFRHTSWYQDSAYEILTKNKTSLVFHDMPLSKTPINYPHTELIYLRFHGPTGKYNGSYSDEYIRQYADMIKVIHTPNTGHLIK